MSLDSNTLVKAVKSAAVAAIAAQKPMSVCYGEVLSASPLKVLVDQKMVLTADQLLLTSAVRDFTVYITVDHTTGSALDGVDLSHTHLLPIDITGETTTGRETQSAGAVDLAHTHAFVGKKKHTVHLGLNAGEKVILLRCDGGQRFILLDRVEVST